MYIRLPLWAGQKLMISNELKEITGSTNCIEILEQMLWLYLGVLKVIYFKTIRYAVIAA